MSKSLAAVYKDLCLHLLRVADADLLCFPAALAIYKEAHFPLALSIFLAQTLWSGLKAVDALTKRVKD